MLDISPVDRTVTVGSRGELAVSRLTASKPRWCGPAPTSELQAKAQLRAHGEEVAVTARIEGDQVSVDFDEPTSAVAPGQAVVLYDGTRVIGSATIDTVARARPARMTTTGLGSLPGDDIREWTKVVLEAVDIPFLAELPARPYGDMLSRAVAVLTELAADLQPAGWRLTGGSDPRASLDQRRARSLLAEDLDVLEELADGYTGPLKVQLTGPWTLAVDGRAAAR